MDIGISILFGLIAAPVCAAIAGHKNRSAIGYGLLGLILPLIGLIVALAVGKRESAEEREGRLRAEGMAFQTGAIAAWQAAQPAPFNGASASGPTCHSA